MYRKKGGVLTFPRSKKPIFVQDEEGNEIEVFPVEFPNFLPSLPHYKGSSSSSPTLSSSSNSSSGNLAQKTRKFKPIRTYAAKATKPSKPHEPTKPKFQPNIEIKEVELKSHPIKKTRQPTSIKQPTMKPTRNNNSKLKNHESHSRSGNSTCDCSSCEKIIHTINNQRRDNIIPKEVHSKPQTHNNAPPLNHSGTPAPSSEKVKSFKPKPSTQGDTKDEKETQQPSRGQPSMPPLSEKQEKQITVLHSQVPQEASPGWIAGLTTWSGNFARDFVKSSYSTSFTDTCKSKALLSIIDKVFPEPTN